MKNNNKSKVVIIRGGFLNPWEMQNFEPLKDEFNITVISSLKPLNGNINLPLVKLASPIDIPNFPYKTQILNRLFVDGQWLIGLEEQLKDVDIVHVAETYFAYTHQAIVAKRKGLVKKVISTCWETIPHNNEGIWGRKKWKQQAYKEIDHFICPTKRAKQSLIDEGCDHKKISVIRMGVNLTNFKYQISNANKNCINILFIGRLEKEKGIWELLKAFQKLSLRYKNIKLNLIGSGKENNNLEDFVTVKKLTNKVSFLGNIGYNQIPKYLKNADFFVLPSKNTKTWQEQYGMVLVEAMASGLAIISTSSGAILEVIDGAGILVSSGNESELLLAIESLISKEELRKSLSLKSIKRAREEFDCNKSANKIGKIYREILKNR